MTDAKIEARAEVRTALIGLARLAARALAYSVGGYTPREIATLAAEAVAVAADLTEAVAELRAARQADQ